VNWGRPVLGPCDYALFFLKRIEGDAQFKLPTTSEEREALIKQAKE